MKKLRFFGLLITVVLLAFGLALGCSNGGTDEEDTSEPDRTTRYVDTANQVEITISNRTIGAKARAPQSGDNYSIKKAGTEVSSGWVELGANNVIIFHPADGSSTFQGILGENTLSVSGVPNPGGGTFSTTAIVPGSAAGGGNQGGTGNQGGGGNIPPVLAPGQPAGFVDATGFVLTGKNYIVLDQYGAGELKMEAKVIPENATSKNIVWAAANSGTTAMNPAPGASGGPTLTVDQTTGVLKITGVTAANYSKALTITPTAVAADNSSGVPVDFPDPIGFEITVYAPATVVPAITLNNPGSAVVSGAAGSEIGYMTYVWSNPSTISLSAPEGWDIYYQIADSDVATTAVPSGPIDPDADTLYKGPISIANYKDAAVGILVQAVNQRSGVLSAVVSQVFLPANAPFTVSLENDDAGYVVTGRTRLVISSVPGAAISYGFGTSGTLTPANTYYPYTGPVVIISDNLNAATGTGIAGQEIHLFIKVIATGYADTVPDATTTANAKLLWAQVPTPAITFRNLASLNWTVPLASSTPAAPGYVADSTSFTLTTPITASIYFDYANDAAVAAFAVPDADLLYSGPETISAAANTTFPKRVFDPNAASNNVFYLRAYAVRDGYKNSEPLDYQGPPGATGLGPAQLWTPRFARALIEDFAANNAGSAPSAQTVSAAQPYGTVVRITHPASGIPISLYYQTPIDSGPADTTASTAVTPAPTLPFDVTLGTAGAAVGDGGGSGFVLSAIAFAPGYRNSFLAKVTYSTVNDR